jgi:hypothetical protein
LVSAGFFCDWADPRTVAKASITAKLLKAIRMRRLNAGTVPRNYTRNRRDVHEIRARSQGAPLAALPPGIFKRTFLLASREAASPLHLTHVLMLIENQSLTLSYPNDQSAEAVYNHEP